MLRNNKADILALIRAGILPFCLRTPSTNPRRCDSLTATWWASSIGIQSCRANQHIPPVFCVPVAEAILQFLSAALVYRKILATTQLPDVTLTVGAASPDCHALVKTVM
jgi:hypothetical protein